MAIPSSALEKLVREIESQAIVAQQQIGLVRGQVAAKQREQRLVRLTLDEVSSLPQGTKVYEGLGKMFVLSPPSKLQEKLGAQTKELDGDIDKLAKRLVYLETTHKNSREHIDQMLKQGFGAR